MSCFISGRYLAMTTDAIAHKTLDCRAARGSASAPRAEHANQRQTCSGKTEESTGGSCLHTYTLPTFKRYKGTLRMHTHTQMFARRCSYLERSLPRLANVSSRRIYVSVRLGRRTEIPPPQRACHTTPIQCDTPRPFHHRQQRSNEHYKHHLPQPHSANRRHRSHHFIHLFPTASPVNYPTPAAPTAPQLTNTPSRDNTPPHSTPATHQQQQQHTQLYMSIMCTLKNKKSLQKRTIKK